MSTAAYDTVLSVFCAVPLQKRVIRYLKIGIRMALVKETVMTKLAPVIIVDDDPDEFELMQKVWVDLKLAYPLLLFSYGNQLLDYLNSDKQTPFLIISDVNLFPMNGFELRKKILEDDSSKFKSVPFIFWSGSANENDVKKAYDLSSHGFFIKASSFQELKETVEDIIAYCIFAKSSPEICTGLSLIIIMVPALPSRRIFSFWSTDTR